MSKIDARSRSVRELLSGVKYSIDYYQREYKWETKNIQELLDDLEAKFMLSYDSTHDRAQIQSYAQYFLGSIVISQKAGQNFIIDGQQRLTSLTLLLIHLNHLQKGKPGRVDVNPLIFSEKYGKKSFNLDVPERTECLEALYHEREYDAAGKPESVQNIVARYGDIQELFPETLSGQALPYFTDWLLENVHLAEIMAFSDEDAYTIFETMNDRGRPLSLTDMLKGYLLANIQTPEDKAAANALWKARVKELVEIDPSHETDFFKAWLRAKYADTIRERKKGATNKDFEKIHNAFHKWVRDEKSRIGLEKSSDFRDLVKTNFDFYSKHYARVVRASTQLTPGLEYIFFNNENDFTLQFPLVLAPLRPTDDPETVDTKIRLVAGYLDIFIARRTVNFRTLGYSAIVYTMFNLMKEIRELDTVALADLLRRKVDEMEEKFDAMADFGLHQQNKWHVHHILARMTQHVEEQCGVPSRFEDYVSRHIKKPFEIEHVWADKYERFKTVFVSGTDFEEYRNRIGGLVLLPQGFNQSLGDDTYEKKVQAYFGQNILAKSLNPKCYENNPSFLGYLKRSGLPFKAYPDAFTKDSLDARQKLYQRICEEIWSTDRFKREVRQVEATAA